MKALITLTALMTLAASAKAVSAQELTCASPQVVVTITDMAATELFSVVRKDPQKPISRGDFSAEVENSYETARSEFTRDCTATLRYKTNIGADSEEIEYKAIMTTDGRMFAKWRQGYDWAAGTYLHLAIKNGLEEVRQRHPNLSEAEIHEIWLLGEPNERNNTADNIARDLSAKIGAGNSNAGAAGGLPPGFTNHR